MMKNIIIAIAMFITSQFMVIGRATAQTVVTNMNTYVTRNELPNQTVWSGTAPNPAPGIFPNVRQQYASFSSAYNWNYNGTDVLSVETYVPGTYIPFWLRPTPGKPNPRFVIRVITPGVTVNFNGFVLSYSGMSSFTWPAGQPFNGTIYFNTASPAFQQVIFSAARDQ
jgi:hypothetical protein